MKYYYGPYLGPDEIYTFVGIGHTQIKVLNDFLPCKGIDETIKNHQHKKDIKPYPAETMFVVFHGRCFRKNSCKRE